MITLEEKLTAIGIKVSELEDKIKTLNRMELDSLNDRIFDLEIGINEVKITLGEK